MHPTLHLFNCPVHSYSFFLAIGIIVGFGVVMLRSHKYNLLWEDVGITLIAGTIGGIAGARIGSVAIEYISQGIKPNLLRGGLSIHGGIIGGFIASAFAAKMMKIDTIKLFDMGSPGVAIGQTIGRIGCFMNGCCSGSPTHMPWGVVYPKDSTYYYSGGIPTHPTQLYDSTMALLIFVILLILDIKPRKRGFIFILFIILECFERIIVEYFRKGASAEVAIGSITYAQTICLIIMIISLLLILRLNTDKTR